MKRTHYFILISIIVCLGLPAYFFMKNFIDQDFSNDTSNWGDFGSYITAAIALCNLVVFIILTFELQRYNEKESEHSKNLQKPILSFYKPDDSSNFAIENVGAGTALNIIVRSNYDSNRNTFNNFNRCYSLRSGSTGELRLNDQINVIVAKYDDIFGNKYYSYFEDNHLRFFSEIDGKKSNSSEYRRANTPIIKYSVEEK